MRVGLLFSRGSLSSLYEDPSHPSYGVRIRRFSETLKGEAGDDPTLAAYLAYFGAITDRVEGLRALGLIELHSDTAIAALAFDDDGLVVFDRSWTVYRVPQKTIARSMKDRSIALRPQRIGLIPGRDEREYIERLWSIPDRGVYVTSRGETFEVRGDAIAARPDLHAQESLSLPVLITSAEPSDLLLRGQGRSFTVVRGDAVLGSSAWSDVLEPARLSGRVTEPTTPSVSVEHGTVHVAVHEKQGPLVRALAFRAAPPFKARFVPLNVNGDIDRYGELVTIEHEGSFRHFLFGKTSLLSKVFVWELFEDREPALRAAYAPLLYGLASKPFTGQNVPVVVTGVRAMPPHSVFVTLAADSILRYDVRAATLQPVFHPGTSVRVTVARQGLVAFSSFNAYKAFLLHLGPE